MSKMNTKELKEKRLSYDILLFLEHWKTCLRKMLLKSVMYLDKLEEEITKVSFLP